MKEKMKKIGSALVVIIILAIAILSYPWKVGTENGETVCRNLLDFKVDCW